MKKYRWVALFVLLPLLVLAATADDDLARHWAYDKTQPLEMSQAGVQERDGIKIYDISYKAPLGDRASLVGPNGGNVTAYLVVPSGTGPFPAVIYGHWCMPGSEKENRKEFLDEAIVLAHSGVISLLPDNVIVHPGFAEDKSPLNEQQVAVDVQQDINLRRGADLLLVRDDVDPKRLAYVGHSCDAFAGAFLSGIDKRFKAFVLMAGGWPDDTFKKSPMYEQYRQKIGAEKFDAFQAAHSWADTGKYLPHAAPAAVFLQFASDEQFATPEMDKDYFAAVSEPKRMKIYEAPHALNADATRDRIAFLAEQLSFKAPDPKAVAGIPALVQPPWPKDAQ
jgi:dienelactone hydrolase